jgi:hypothetical protein
MLIVLLQLSIAPAALATQRSGAISSECGPLWLSRFSFEPRIILSVDNQMVNRILFHERYGLVCRGR